MISTTSITAPLTNTSHKVVVPFYIYSAVSFLAATGLLLFSTDAFSGHHFHPKLLAITHLMALGWGTMMILGASHQLVPVLIEATLFSNALAYVSFFLAAAGIPLLVWSFLEFRFDSWALIGGGLINTAVLAYLVNVYLSISNSKVENVHAIFIATAAAWLFLTTFSGWLLMMNFTMDLFSKDSLHFLSLHAHLGIAGWFLLLVLGVGSRLIPMFLISKYSNTKALWWIYWLVNGGLILFVIIFYLQPATAFYILPLVSVFSGVLLFAHYCRLAWSQRIRKSVDQQMKVSLLSVLMMVLPLLLLVAVIGMLLLKADDPKLVLAYGFSIFFGWITTIILGMTFKTLPFIIWNKVYHEKAGLGKTPNPKELYSTPVFNLMSVAYLVGFIIFLAGILTGVALMLQAGTILLLVSALLYNGNVFRLISHKSIV